MKKIKYLVVAISLMFASACDKADSVIFEDKSTAIGISKIGWTITASSFSADEAPNGTAEKLIDNDSKTYWHTNYAVVTPYPHWVLIDMKKENKMISVGITNRYAATPNSVGMKKFKLEGSNDGTTFSSLGEFNFAISNDSQNFPVSSDKAYRYLKLTALEPQKAGTNHTFLGEIDVFGVK
ncbi:discoidin domain-containing protein [Pedobacter polaris]|uniref:Discoidin domain-containing protein n=1 Tax=Pedobacter polaris TaxID=2571273 RepID=A0A4U1CH96_9SPHI|nr:discoidin domain-containing protein [Pedobacter polaris]TKC05715.1 discoidin domain-containing protein [Pedobacter polaris]